MNSLRTRITLLTVFVVIIALFIVTLSSVLFIRNAENRESEQMLYLLCETGEHNLDYYFNSVQKSVAKVASFIEKDLDGLETEQMERHMERVGRYFDELVYKTNGVLTYYYRIDPEISDTVKGFWYTNLDGEGFVEHEVTDITRYDTQDTSRLVWFTVPKHEGTAIWLPPYITDNLDVRVISYNVPIYYHGQFVGVVGIEIDYTTMAEEVESIRLYSNGYAFLSDSDGNLFYHPHIDIANLADNSAPEVPEGMLGNSTFVRYTYDGVEKQAAWLPLNNGMRIYVTVPVSETVADWHRLVNVIIIISAAVLLVMSIFTMFYTKRISGPLEQLTEAAEKVDNGNYDFTLTYSGKDEVGRLTSTFKRLADHMKEHISDLNRRVYVDALTSVRNKGAFTTAIEKLQRRVDEGEKDLEFAIGMLDCDNLKMINDQYGHEKGDIYLKTGCQMICKVFSHSPVYRIGGDEFAVIFQNDDYKNRDELVRQFERECEKINAENENKWKHVNVSIGVGVYDPENDHYVIDIVQRADKTMYRNKQARKANRVD